MRHAEPVLPASVLVVADDVGLLHAASDALVVEGFHVVAAQSGAGALHHVNEGFRPAVLVSTVRMPGISGVELADAIREISPSTAIMFLADSSADADHLSQQPGVTVVVKPFAIVDVVSRLRDLGVGRNAVEMFDYPLDQGVASAPRPERLRHMVWPWIAAGLLVAVAWLVNDFLSRRPAAPSVPSAPTDLPTPPPVRRAAAGQPLPFPVPSLDVSDTLVRELTHTLSSHPRVVAWLATDVSFADSPLW